MAKSLCLTYLFWLFGGGFGLHHFYLNRNVQGFLWLCLPGGYFGLGWFRDLWRIPSYVREANDDPTYLNDITEQMRTKKKPPFSIMRVLGQLIVGNVFGQLLQMSIPGPEDLNGLDLLLVADLLAPLATAVGITLVGNIGKEKGSFWWPFIGCYLMTPFHIMGRTSYLLTTIMGILAFQIFAKTWRRQVREPPGQCKRFFIILICFSLYLSLWSAYIYFNLKITTADGDKIKFRDAAENFIKSPAFQEFTQTLKNLWLHLLEHGFGSTFQQLIESLDPLGEKHALKILELKRGVSQEEIRSRYRELSKKWHPDRFTDEKDKIEANDKFVLIQQAYERLSSIKKRRKTRNTVDQSDDRENERKF